MSGGLLSLCSRYLLFGRMVKLGSCRLVLVTVLLSVCCFAVTSENETIAKASVLVRSGKTKQAEAVLRSAVAAHPDSATLHGGLGKILFQQQKYEQAAQELGLAAQQFPNSREYNLLLAEALIGWRHFGVAIDFLHAVGPRFENEAQYHYDLALAYYNLNDMALARKDVEEALRLNSNLAPARFLHGACLLATGDSVGALLEFQKGVQQKPGKATYWAELAQVLQTTGSKAEALRAVQHALTLAPRDAHVQYVAATVFTESGDYARALPYWERLEKLDPNVLAVHVQLSRVYSLLGRRDLAHKQAAIANQLRTRSSSQDSRPIDQLAPGTAQ
jgi:tetratricopeptide (TPR) repeat protein